MSYRVVKWTTGNVGKSSVKAIAANPTLELVGCYAWSAEKAGRDVGELCGIEPLNVTASTDIDALLALKPSLGRSHAKLLAERGATVVVNDLGVGPDGRNFLRANAEEVADEISATGGEAVPDLHTVADQDSARRVVQTALDGRTCGTPVLSRPVELEMEFD